MRIVHTVTHYDLLTGSGMYVYELSRVLAGRGHHVSVVAANVGGELTARTRTAQVSVHPLDDLPKCEPDIVHAHQAAPAEVALLQWPSSRVVVTVHSPWPADAPIRSERVQTYICVRPDIRSKVVGADGIARERTTVVLNGVDRSRFRPRPAEATSERPAVLFAGTWSDARRDPALELIGRSRRDLFDVVFLGIGPCGYLDDLPPNVRWERREVWNIEDFVARCDQTAGTSFGRTTIEGWLCGKPAWVYDTGMFGRIRSVSLHAPPPPAVLDLFDIEYMTDAIERVYAEALR
jgi:glycosyltransferase involved in cell wall biosynthesis